MQHLPGTYSNGAVLAVSTALFLGACFAICLCFPNNQKRKYKVNLVSLLLTAAMLIISMLSMSGVSTFIYNDF